MKKIIKFLISQLKISKKIPFREQWIYKNKKALESVKKGLKQSGKGKVTYLGDFSQYLE